MIVLRDEARIERLKQTSKYLSWAGLLVMAAAMIPLFTVNPETTGGTPWPLIAAYVALPIGWLLSQASLYLMHRYRRNPRPDEVLDQALRKVVRQGRMYHYLLPAPHVLLTPAGPIVFVTKFQTGRISADGGRWQQRGVGVFRKLFSQESLGNPAKEAERYVRALAGYIDRHAPKVEEVPVGAIIVFTSKNIAELDVENSSIPAMHHTKLRGYLKQQGPGEPLPQATYEALREAFDKKAAGITPTDA